MHVELVNKRWVYANKECTLNTSIMVRMKSSFCDRAMSGLSSLYKAFTQSPDIHIRMHVFCDRAMSGLSSLYKAFTQSPDIHIRMHVFC